MTPEPRHRHQWAVAGNVLLVILLITLTALAWGGWLDDTGRDYTERGLTRALVAFAAARGLNGVISVAQGTEVAIEPAGVGVTLAPGEILDPVNDLVERFSWVLLASGTSLGIQRVLVNATASMAFTVAVSIAAGIAIAALLASGCAPRWRRLCLRLAIWLLAVRFAVPVMAISSEMFFNAFLERDYVQSSAQLAASSNVLIKEEIDVADSPEQSSLFDRLMRYITDARDALAVDDSLAGMKQAAEKISEQVLNLIVVFVIQTLLFPLLFLWLVMKLTAGLLRSFNLDA